MRKESLHARREKRPFWAVFFMPVGAWNARLAKVVPPLLRAGKALSRGRIPRARVCVCPLCASRDEETRTTKTRDAHSVEAVWRLLKRTLPPLDAEAGAFLAGGTETPLGVAGRSRSARRAETLPGMWFVLFRFLYNVTYWHRAEQTGSMAKITIPFQTAKPGWRAGAEGGQRLVPVVSAGASVRRCRRRNNSRQLLKSFFSRRPMPCVVRADLVK